MTIRANAEYLRALGGPGSGPHKGGSLYNVPDVIGDDPRPQLEIISFKRRANYLHEQVKQMTPGRKSTIELQKELNGIIEHISKLESKK